ncbi:hypothetical protein ES703_121959 [subsurface metagenome]
MKLEESRNKHAGEEIFILGSGPSIDDLPDNFFDDKISIAVNWMYIAFPNCTYYFNIHREEAAWIVKDRPERIHKLICGCPSNGRPDLNQMNEYGNIPMYVLWGVAGFNGFVESVSSIMRGKACSLADIATSVQPAIQVAAILGARKITLVGCEARTSKYQYHAQRRGLDKFYIEKKGVEYAKAAQRDAADWFRRCKLGAKWLSDLFGPYGVSVKRFYYKTGYEEI